MVRLYEYQCKNLLKSVGIPVPEGEVASTPHEAMKIAERIGKPVVIKAQVLTTGRFKAGGIKFADSPQEAESIAWEMLGGEIRGLKVEKVLVEERLDVEKEFFLSIIVNDSYKVKGPTILFSTEGGVDVEEVAEKYPEKISSIDIDYLRGLQLPDAQRLVSKLEVPHNTVDLLSNIACKLYEVFVKTDASVVEINPIILTREGRLVAGDCRITIDDNSVFRHPEFKIEVPRDMMRPPMELEITAWKEIEEGDYRGVSYFVQLNPNIDEIRKGGYIAFHGIGGGAAMLAADALMRKGLKLATYVDTSGNPAASKVYRVVKLILSIPGIEGYCLAGAVLANQEQWYHAYAIVKAFREEAKKRPGFPVLILIAGNKERETHRIIREGLRDLPLRWELYGRDHIYDVDFIADRMIALVEEYRREKERIGGPSVLLEEERIISPKEYLSFETQTGKVFIDLSKCIAPKCGFACVKADRWYGRPCLRIVGGKIALTGSPEELKRTCNECLACEVVCELYGGKAITVELPVRGLEEFRRKYGELI